MKVGAVHRANIVRIFCAIALLCVGFAHKAPIIEGGIPASQIAAYTFPDGTVPVICLGSQEDGGEGHHHYHRTSCEACRITAAVLLPTPPENVGERSPLEEAYIWPSKAEIVCQRRFLRALAPRAPPLNSISV